jgi:hypothetical protein
MRVWSSVSIAYLRRNGRSHFLLLIHILRALAHSLKEVTVIKAKDHLSFFTGSVAHTTCECIWSVICTLSLVGDEFFYSTVVLDIN